MSKNKGWKPTPLPSNPTTEESIKFLRAELNDAYEAGMGEKEFWRHLSLMLYAAETVPGLERRITELINQRTRMIQQLEKAKQFVALRGGDVAPIEAVLNSPA